jgi:GTP pyrophosphokinase
MIRFNDIINKVLLYNSNADIELLSKAYVFSAKVHKGQKRLSGEPYLIHPLEVASIIADLRMDVNSIATGLLHDTVEDGYITIKDIAETFNEEIKFLVDSLTKISKFQFSTKKEKEAEDFRKMILAMSKDIRVVLIKLADRLHNMRTLGYLPDERQKKIAEETLNIYAPLSNRLGIGWMKAELEDLAFRHLKPQIYYDLLRSIAKNKDEREKYIEDVKRIISEKLSEYGLHGEVSGRPKHLYSIYIKMKNDNITFDQVYDLIAFRIILNSVKECYEALGIIHSMWIPVPGRFKDYIALPKSNMYQSLHTTVIGPYGERIEIQIRTHEMHIIAEEGIAAHWKYKEKNIISEKSERQLEWLRQLIELQKDLKDPNEFLETVKINLFPDEVYVFTPKGDVKVFSKGATPIDFAYSIHTDIGNHCIGAKVNGKLVPLKYQLNSGDIVEILTSPTRNPSRDWIKFATTSKARTKIRQWIKNEERERSLSIGRDICEREFSRYNMNFSKLLKSDKLIEVAKELSFKDIDSLISAVGYGKISPIKIVDKILPDEKIKKPSDFKTDKIVKNLKSKGTSGIKIGGIENILVRFGKCCNPIPGDEIVGFITRGRGITVHTVECSKILEDDPARKIDVEWDVKEEVLHPVKIKVVCADRKGLLANISSSISSAEVNIASAQIKTTQDKKGIDVFEIEVQDLKQLKEIINSLEKIKGVIKVERFNR